MAFGDERRDNKIYLAISIFIIVVIIVTIFFSGNELIPAKIKDEALNGGWIEDISERESGSGFLGIEKWASFTYKNNNESYPAYITVTSFKTLFMANEQGLKEKMEDTIRTSFSENTSVDFETKITGERTLGNGHKTLYCIYEGNTSINQLNEKIKLVGETWNCGISGTSIICIGYAQITDNVHNKSGVDITHWIKIIKDAEGTFGEDFRGIDGLLYNSKCH